MKKSRFAIISADILIAMYTLHGLFFLRTPLFKTLFSFDKKWVSSFFYFFSTTFIHKLFNFLAYKLLGPQKNVKNVMSWILIQKQKHKIILYIVHVDVILWMLLQVRQRCIWFHRCNKGVFGIMCVTKVCLVLHVRQIALGIRGATKEFSLICVQWQSANWFVV